MANPTIRLANIEDVPLIEHLANEIWPLVYDYMISSEQIHFMLNKMYSPEALTEQMQILNHKFIILQTTERSFGFASFHHIDAQTFRLNKLYLHPSQQGKGWGKLLLNHVVEEAKHHGAKTLELNVNKNNTSIAFYKANGFGIEKEEVIDIGNGFVMDDYVMRLQL